MPATLILQDARGRPVPLARVPRRASAAMDGLGAIKTKGLKKFWVKYSKPIIGGALAAGAVAGALYTGGATLSAVPGLLGKVAKGAGGLIDSAGGAGGILSAAGSLFGGRGGGGGNDGGGDAQAAGYTASTMATDSGYRGPASFASYREAPSSGLAGIPTPLLIGGGVAVLAVLFLMTQRPAAPTAPSVIEVRRP